MARERKFSKQDLFHAVEDTLKKYGYEGFTFGHLSEQLEISRGAIYKYYDNKEDLILDFMIHKMKVFFEELTVMKRIEGFREQFDYLFKIMFSHSYIVQVMSIVHQNPFEKNEKLVRNKERMDQYHLEIYKELQDFLILGKKEGVLREDLPGPVMLGMIFQTIMMKNHFSIPEDDWVLSIKEILCHGMFTDT